MGIWDGVQNAQIFERGTFLEEGHYKARIKRCLDKTTRKSGQAFIAEFELIESSNQAKHPIGQTASWFQKLTDKDVAFPAIKAFVAAVLGYDMSNKSHRDHFEANVGPQLVQILNHSCDEKINYLKDKVVEIDVVKVTTTKGLPFSRHTFTPVKVST